MRNMIVGAGKVKPAPIPTVIRDEPYQADIYPAPEGKFRLDILLPVHAHIELTVSCLRSIRNYTQAPHHIIVLDDAPADDYGITERYIKEQQAIYSNITYCHSHVPFRCGNAFFNLGLRYCRSEYVATIMNSITVEPAWETVALEIMNQDKQIGSVGFKCLFPDGKIESAGLQFVGHIPTDMGRDEPGYRCSEIRDAEAVQWAFALHRKAALMGTLEENIYHGHVGWDDIDNNLCVRKKGWKVVYCGQGVGIHLPRASRGSNSVTAFLKNRDNACIFFKRWGLWQQFWEGSKMDVSHRLKHETKDKLGDVVTAIQVLESLIKQHERAIAPMVAEALKELGVDPNAYQLEMNPKQDTWVLKPNAPKPVAEETLAADTEKVA